MIVHRDCDSDGECSCSELSAESVVIDVDGAYAVISVWAYEALRRSGVELRLAEVMVPPSHREFGHIEL